MRLMMVMLYYKMRGRQYCTCSNVQVRSQIIRIETMESSDLRLHVTYTSCSNSRPQNA